MRTRLCFKTTRPALITLALVSLVAMTSYYGAFQMVILSDFHPRKPEEPPIILLYNSWSLSPINGPPWRRNILREDLWDLTNCPANCSYTVNRDKYEIIANLVIVTVSGAVSFGPAKSYMKNHLSRWGKNSNQIWLAVNLEAPRYFDGVSDRSVDNSFHWTASYRTDSHVYWPYGQLRRVNRSTALRPPGDLRKEKLVSWLVSSCDSASEREVLVNTLRQYVPVDVYGLCGSPCPESPTKSCHQFLKENYKFYLAFENSLCLEYVTEKFFFPLGGMVPITYGWSNYSNIAPPHSYINALDFKSVQELAAYLKWLDANDDEYLKYFEWTRSYQVEGNVLAIGMCNACKSYLRFTGDGRDVQPPEYINGITEWFRNLPPNWDRTKSNRRLRVGGVDFDVQNVCLEPRENETLSGWIRGKR